MSISLTTLYVLDAKHEKDVAVGLIAKWLLGCNVVIVPEYRSSDMHVL